MPQSLNQPTVKLQWLHEPPKELVVSVGQEIKIDCLAFGEPKPSMKWEKLGEPTSFASISSNRVPVGGHSRRSQHADGILMSNGIGATATTQSGPGLNGIGNNNQLAQLISSSKYNNTRLELELEHERGT